MPVNQTDKYISDLESEIQYLKKLLDDNGISYDYEAHLRALQSDVGNIVFPELGPEHANYMICSRDLPIMCSCFREVKV